MYGCKSSPSGLYQGIILWCLALLKVVHNHMLAVNCYDGSVNGKDCNDNCMK